MGKAIKPPYNISSGLLPDTHLQYVDSFFYIDIPKGEDIKLSSIIPEEGFIDQPDGKAIPCVVTTITYKAFEADYPERNNVRFEHPGLLGFPHQVLINIFKPDGGSSSTVSDIAD